MKPVAASPGSECEKNPRAITRRQLLGSLAGMGAGSVLVLPGCEALQEASAPGREGTGIQGSLFVKVLLKYPASPRQQAVARDTARRAFVDRGMRPAFADAKKKAQQRHRKQEAVARRQNAGDPAKQQQAVAQVQEEGSRQLAAIEDSYRKVALQITDNKYSGEFAPARSSRTVAQVETRPQILTASAAYVAPDVRFPCRRSGLWPARRLRS